ncbi:SDR family oxidoreductase [Pontibacter sp. E15-1]|uniref:SDR family oxidoreductase n=1 Tax=Pontibacter sp. E15-1 TaxID=2919918 RepID=UPI00293F57BB|nr:SDR family oxidoreductase [Pontibacter sp. E15-1]
MESENTSGHCTRTWPGTQEKAHETNTMKNKRLQGKVAVVTGSSAGIGQAIALAMGQEGASVVINYHANEAPAQELKARLEEGGGKAVVVQADTGNPADVERLFRAATDAFGTVDILVSNAGIQRDAAVLDMTLEEWQQVIDTNLTGYFLCAQAAAREFTKRKVDPEARTAAGHILFISSVHDIIPWAGHVNYATAKGGVQMLMKTLAQELAPNKIRVNSIAPGAIKTGINQEVWETREGSAGMLSLIPYGRIGEPEDVAKVAVWLATDEADYITGTTLYVDGGMTLYPGFSDKGCCGNGYKRQAYRQLLYRYACYQTGPLGRFQNSVNNFANFVRPLAAELIPL